MNVFVYGTLKKGFALHEKGLAQAEYQGIYVTVEPYPMVIAGSFFGPMMLERPGEGLMVSGELYEIEESQLDRLDELENVGQPGSYRTILRVQPEGGGIEIDAVGFMKSEAWLDPIHSDHLSDYQDRRFIPPWERE